jgi:zinc transporter ZupT
LGTAANKDNVRTVTKYVCFFLFVCAAPAGVGIGLRLSQVSVPTLDVLRALAAGIFLYLGSWHLVLQAELGRKTFWIRALSLFAYAAGFGIMSLLAIWS